MTEHAMVPDRDLRWAWLVGVLGAVAVVGPGLRSGSWLNLDLVVTPVTPVPRGAWALGPELPRRVPFALPFAWISALWPSEWPWKAAVVVSLASCSAGTWRLVRHWGPDTSSLVRGSAALIVAIGPFGATRLGAGHLGMTFALALLPWAMPRLLRPLDAPASTVGWALGLAVTGPFGGTVMLPPLLVGLLVAVTEGWRAPAGDRSSRLAVMGSAGKVAAGSVIAQLPWLVPTLVVAGQGADVAGGAAFATDLSGPGGPLRVVVGHGFWRPLSQVGGDQGWELGGAGVLLLVAAGAGLRVLPDRYRLSAALTAGLALVAALASGVAGLDGLAGWVVDLPGGASIREGQRLLALWMVIAVPVAAVGVERIASRVGGAAAGVVSALPLAITVLLVGPGLWGVGGALEPVHLPAGWAEVRERVVAEPGPVMALPWRAYPQPAVVGGRSVSQPLAVYLGGDVLTSSDARLGDRTSERADRREPRAALLAEAMGDGQAVAAELRDLGVRWLVDIKVVDDRTVRVPSDPGLRTVYSDDDIALYEVEGWRAAWRADSGASVEISRPIAPLIRVDDSSADEAEVVVAAPASPQWRPQIEGANGHGLLALPPGAHSARAAGAVVAIAAYVLAAAMAALLVMNRWRRRANTESS